MWPLQTGLTVYITFYVGLDVRDPDFVACWGGGVLLYFHTNVGSGHFFCIQNFEFHSFLGFQKNKYFWGYEDFVDIFWGHHIIGLYFGVISMHFRVFS